MVSTRVPSGANFIQPVSREALETNQFGETDEAPFWTLFQTF